MRLVNVFVFYSLATKLRRIDEIQGGNALAIGIGGTSCFLARHYATEAFLALRTFSESGTYALRTAKIAEVGLTAELTKFISLCQRKAENDDKSVVDYGDIHPLKEALRKFETVMGAELGQAGFFVADPKAAFDIGILINEGQKAFSRDLLDKCPLVEGDARQAMRCIAFDLPTAAAFHLHRLHEGVIGYLWDHLTQGQNRPKGLGKYVEKFEKMEGFDKNLLSCIRDIKDLHRNPVVHPEQTIDGIEEAISLQGIISSSIALMLRHIPAKKQA